MDPPSPVSSVTSRTLGHVLPLHYFKQPEMGEGDMEKSPSMPVPWHPVSKGL